jgi:ketosteroid isomerase-like protein
MPSTQDVLAHHLHCFDAGDVDGILSDYAADAVLFTPTGPLKGPEALRPMFAGLVAEFAKPGATFEMLAEYVEGDYAYVVWRAETADHVYDFATDTLIVRGGKIVAQSFAAKVIAKH